MVMDMAYGLWPWHGYAYGLGLCGRGHVAVGMDLDGTCMRTHPTTRPDIYRHGANRDEGTLGYAGGLSYAKEGPWAGTPTHAQQHPV